MKFIDEYRDSRAIKALSDKIWNNTAGNCNIMEICGGQTHTILKYNLGHFLPEEITLIHGPGCPVCVTPLEKIDKAIQLAGYKEVILASFGDMLRVPGSKHDLLSIKAMGGDVRIVLSPLDAVKLAQNNRNQKVVFFAVGFETTAPANAMSVLTAKKLGLDNYSILCSHVLVPPALELLLSSRNTRINAVLAAGHVCTVMGFDEYIPLSEKYKIPIVVTGFEPTDILEGIYLAVKQLAEKKHYVENQYSRAVKKQGNLQAKAIMKEVYESTDRNWRGIGNISNSGLKLRQEYEKFDAEVIFDLSSTNSEEPSNCIAGEILQGTRKPYECPEFQKSCTPEHPLGAPMVSSEGACAAYFRYNEISKRK